MLALAAAGLGAPVAHAEDYLWVDDGWTYPEWWDINGTSPGGSISVSGTGEISFTPPRTSFVSAFSGVIFSDRSGGGTVRFGVRNPGGQWVSSVTNPDGWTDAGGSNVPGAQAVVTIDSTSSSDYVQLSGIFMYLGDPDNPTLTNVSHTVPAWVKTGTFSANGAADDPGLGVEKLELLNGTTVVGSKEQTCSPKDPWCPTALSGPVNFNAAALPEGRLQLSLRAVDWADHVSNVATIPVNIDRTAPLTPSGFVTPAYNAGSGIATVDWAPSADPILEDGSPGSGVALVEARYKLNNGSFGAWTTASSNAVSVAGSVNDVVTVEVRATDAAGNVSAVGRARLTIKDTTLRLAVGGELASDPLQAEQEEYGLTFDASDPNADVSEVRILIDNVEREAFEPASGCTSPCGVEDSGYGFDTDWVSEGLHTITVEATNNDGDVVSQSWQIEVLREAHFAGRLWAWGSDVQSQVDTFEPGALTGPIPRPPDDWSDTASCEASEQALEDCYDAITDWGESVEAWLGDNLTDGSDAGSLPLPPVLPNEISEGLATDLTKQIASTFEYTRHMVATPDEPIDIALGFHEPLTPAQVEAALPQNAVMYSGTEIRGYFDNGRYTWQGSDGASDVESVADSLDDFYTEQHSLAGDLLAQSDDQPDDDVDEQDEIAASVASLQSLQTALTGREPYVSALTVRLMPDAGLAARSTSSGWHPSIKNMRPVSAGAGASRSEILGTMQVDAAALDTGSSARSAAADGDTCEDRNEDSESIVPHSVKHVSPAYYAPSRFHSNVTPSALVDGHNVFINARWWAARSLTWFCMDKPDENTIELEANVYPSDNERWATDWINDQPSRSLISLPGQWFLDDINKGVPPGSYSPQKYPDFALVFKGGRQLRYGHLYKMVFRTNKGPANDGRVIWTAQANTPSYSKAYTAYCKSYLLKRGDDFPHCRFARVTTCYGVSYVSDSNAFFRRVNWNTVFGTSSPRLSDVPASHKDPNNPNEVDSYCDPRP